MLNDEHYEVMELIEGGATVWGYVEAKRLREVQKFAPELLTIIKVSELENVTGEVFDGAEQMPYFGAILTNDGRKELRKWRNEKLSK